MIICGMNLDSVKAYLENRFGAVVWKGLNRFTVASFDFDVVVFPSIGKNNFLVYKLESMKEE